MRLKVNLASEDYRKTRLIQALVLLLCLLFIGLGVFQAQIYLESRQEIHRLQEALDKVKETRASVEADLAARGMNPTEGGVKELKTQVGAVNGLISYKAFSWTLLLNELESAVPENISVAKLQPRFPEGVINLAGKARSLKDLTRFIIRLEDSPAFEEVFLKDQKTNDEGMIEFTVEFQYYAQKQRA